MTEKLSSSNPSWGPCLRKNKTHKKKKNVGSVDSRHEAAVASRQCNRFGFGEPNIRDGRSIAGGGGGQQTTWKTSGRLVSPWAAAFTSPRSQQRGKAQHCEYQKRGAKKRCAECFSPPLTYRFESRGDSSFYLPRGGGFQRRGGGAVSWVILPSARSSRLETSLLPCVA